MTIGERIKAARLSLGLTQEELGRCCSASKQTIFKYETGIVTNIPVDNVEAIASRLGVTPAYIMGWDDSPAPQPSEVELDEKLVKILTQLKPDEVSRVLDFISGLIAARKD